MRVVFDTSALVHLAISRNGLLKLKVATSREMVIVSSDYLLSELERTLYKRLGATGQQARITTRAIRKMVVLAESSDIPNVSRDPTDDPVLAAAVAGKADFLVANDKDLIELKRVSTIRIVSFSEFLQKPQNFCHEIKCIFGPSGD